MASHLRSLERSKKYKVMFMPQPRETKEAWRSFRWNGARSVFNFKAHGLLVDFVDRNVPRDCHLVSFGGGNGALLAAIDRHERTFGNLDISEAPTPLVPTRRWDMEQPLPRSGIVTDGRPLAIVTPFSVEYTEIAVSTANIAEVLQVRERYLALCHHADSQVLKEFEMANKMIAVLGELLLRLNATQPKKWLDVVVEFEPRADGIFETQARGKTVYVATASQPVFKELEEWLKRSPQVRETIVFKLLVLLRKCSELSNVVDRITASNGAMVLIKTTKEEFESDSALSKMLLERRIRSADDLARHVDRRLQLVGTELYSKDGIKVVCASFERT